MTTPARVSNPACVGPAAGASAPSASLDRDVALLASSPPMTMAVSAPMTQAGSGFLTTNTATTLLPLHPKSG